MQLVRYLIACFLALTLTACSSDPEESKVSAEDVKTLDDMADWSENLPDCADIWVDGRTLPKNYEGCQDGDTVIAAVSVPCDRDGAGDIYTHEPEDGGGFFTDEDGVIHDGGEDYTQDPLYGELYEACH